MSGAPKPFECAFDIYMIRLINLVLRTSIVFLAIKNDLDDVYIELGDAAEKMIKNHRIKN